jgi:integrase
VKHRAALSVAEVGDFMVRLRDVEGVGARALEFAVLTAARSGEARGATWAEVDLKENVWTVAAERMKAGREHRVPLSPAAAARLATLPRMTATDLVFPARHAAACFPT